MGPNRLTRLALAMLILLVLGIGCRPESGPRARQGVLDLRGQDLDRGDPVRLDGEWAFHWKQLLDPAAFGAGSGAPGAYLELPAPWNPALVQGHRAGGVGYATLRLRILTGPGREPLALRLFGIQSACRLWVNGRLEAECGQVGLRAAEERPDHRVRLVSLGRPGPVLDLVLQVSNFHFQDGGVPLSLVLGRASVVQARQDRTWGISLFLLGSIFVMGIYHLVLFGFRPGNRSPLWFGSYCLLWVGNMVGDASTDWVIGLFLPDLSAALLYRATLLCFFLSVPVGYRLFRGLYPEEFPAWLLRVCEILGGGFALAALLAPMRLLSGCIPFYYAISIVLVLYTLAGIHRAWRRGRAGAVYFLCGFTLLGAVAINDMFDDMGLIHTGLFIHVGMFLFILLQAIALSDRFSRAFSEVEDLSAELARNNLALETEIRERIQLEREVVEISGEERRRISQELHDGLCQLLTAARMRFAVLARRCSGTAAEPDLEPFAKLLGQAVDDAYEMSHGLWPIEEDPKDIAASLEGLARRSAEAGGINVTFRQRSRCAACSNPNVTQLYFIAREAIGNALKHARPGWIRVELDCCAPGRVTLRVEDDGIGRRAVHKGPGGLGLRIMAHRARMLGGEFRIEDGEAGRGTAVICSVPCLQQAQPPA